MLKYEREIEELVASLEARERERSLTVEAQRPSSVASPSLARPRHRLLLRAAPGGTGVILGVLVIMAAAALPSGVGVLLVLLGAIVIAADIMRLVLWWSTEVPHDVGTTDGPSRRKW